jgi:hypothetical protein
MSKWRFIAWNGVLVQAVADLANQLYPGYAEAIRGLRSDNSDLVVTLLSQRNAQPSSRPDLDLMVHSQAQKVRDLPGPIGDNVEDYVHSLRVIDEVLYLLSSDAQANAPLWAGDLKP